MIKFVCYNSKLTFISISYVNVIEIIAEIVFVVGLLVKSKLNCVLEEFFKTHFQVFLKALKPVKMI